MSSLPFVFKILIAVLTVVGARQLTLEQDGPGYEWSNIERYWTECPTNKVLVTKNQSEPSQSIELKRVIDEKHPILINVKVIHKNTGAEVYSGENLNICMHDEWDTYTWELIVIRFFKATMMPQSGWHVCPIDPEVYEIYRRTHNMIEFIPTALSFGNYEISFTAKSDDGEVIFSTLKFKFVCKDSNIDWQD